MRKRRSQRENIILTEKTYDELINKTCSGTGVHSQPTDTVHHVQPTVGTSLTVKCRDCEAKKQTEPPVG